MKQYYPALTGVRALAAYAVFFFHFNHLTRGSFGWKLVNNGGLGVNVFFVLSGFLICLRYIDRLAISRAWLLVYFRNRIARIYPLYLLLTCLTFAAIICNPKFDLTGQWTSYRHFDKAIVFGLNLTLLRGFFSKFLFTGIAQGWTLTVEETFYASAPFLLLGLAGRKFPALRLGFYALIFLSLGYFLIKFAPHPFGFFSSPHFLLFTFFGRCIEFLIGIGLALLVRRLNPTPMYSFAWRTYVGVVVGAICLAGWNLVHKPTDDVIDGPFNISGFIILYVILPFAIALFFSGLIYERTPVRWLLETPLFNLLGKSSYAFYLVHMGIFSQLLAQYVSSSVLLNFVLLEVLAIGLFRFIEEPLHRVLAPTYKSQPLFG